MTAWLDQCISEVWHSHNSSAESQDAALRMELRAMQNQNIMEASANRHLLNQAPRSGHFSADDGTEVLYEEYPQRSDGVSHHFPHFDQAAHDDEGMDPGYGWSPPGHASMDINSRDQRLWSAMLQAVSTCASSLTQHLATTCYEVSLSVQ